MYKVANGMSPELMNEIFQLIEKSQYNLRYTSEFISGISWNMKYFYFII